MSIARARCEPVVFHLRRLCVRQEHRIEAQRVLTATGGNSAGLSSHPLDATDYSSFLLRAQSSGAKVVAFGNAGLQLVTPMKQWQEFGMNAESQRPVALNMFLTDAHSMGPAVGHGLTALTAWYWDLDDESRAFFGSFFQAAQ